MKASSWLALCASAVLVGCDNTSVPGGPATLRVVLDSGLPPGTQLTVRVGDSSVTVRPGEMSRCLRWQSLGGTRLADWTFVVGDSTSQGQYLWKVQPPNNDLYIWEENGWITFSWVDRPCGDRLIAVP